MRVMVLGISGMLGNAVFRILSEDKTLEIHGTARSSSVKQFFPHTVVDNIVSGVDIENYDSLANVFATIRPQIVVNCIGLIKQLADSDNPLVVLPINAMFPHRLAQLCDLSSARMIHISSDCVFSGLRGNYKESDESDAKDLYGKSKFLGEVLYPHTITLRTSIVGRELASKRSLMGWFLSQQGQISGYTHSIFSGLPTVELARVIHKIILEHPDLFGLYHVASDPISKYDLLSLVAEVYDKEIDINADDSVVVDRSLNSDRFRSATSYSPPTWVELVKQMHKFN